MELTKEEEQIIQALKHEKITIQGKEFYSKKVLTKELGVFEKVGYRLATAVGIKCPTSYLYKLNGDYYILSEKIPDFKTAAELKIPESTLYSIWIDSFVNFPNTEDLMNQIVKVYCFDCILINCDRTLLNWGISFVDKPTVYALDHELLFSHALGVEITCALEKNNKMDIPYQMEENLTRIVAEIKSFLQVSSAETIEEFWQMYESLNPSFVQKVLKEENASTDTIENVMKLYKKHYKNIGELKKGRKH